VDRAGVGVPDLTIWAIGGLLEHPRVVARTTTGAGGRFVLPRPSERSRAGSAGFVDILALARDGRLGWRMTGWPEYPQTDELRIVLSPVGEVRGPLNDQDGRSPRPTLIAPPPWPTRRARSPSGPRRSAPGSLSGSGRMIPTGRSGSSRG
jgi:hypothetical protein